MLVVGAPLRSLHRLYNCAVVIHRGKVLGVAPKVAPAELPRVLRAPALRLRGRPGRRRDHGRRRGRAVRPDLLFTRGRRAADWCCTSRSARTCGCRSRPAPTRRSPVRRCSRTSPAQPDHGRPRRGPPAAGALRVGALPGGVPVRRGRPGRVQHRPVLGRPDDGLRGRRPARRERALPRRPAAYDGRRRPQPHPAGAAAPGHLRRQPRDGRGATGEWTTIEFTLDPPAGDIGLRRRVDRFPFVPDDPERLALDCYEAYNIQVSGLEQRLRAIGHPKVVIGVSGGLDSTHALIVAANAMDRLGRPRSDIHAFTMPGFATSERHQGERDPARRGAGRDVRGDRHPAGRPADAGGPRTTRSPTASRSTTSRSRTSRRGCAPTTCSGSPTTAAASCSAPATCRSSRWAGAPTASATRCRTTREHRRAQDADPAPDPVGGRHRAVRRRGQRRAASRSSTRRSPPSWCRSRRARGRRAPRTPSAPTRCRTSRCSTSFATASRRAGSRSSPQHAWSDADARGLAAGVRRGPPHRLRPADDPALARGVRRSGSSRSASSSGRRCRTVRRWLAGGSLSPRGDWRAPSDGNARVWLDELHRNVPQA